MRDLDRAITAFAPADLDDDFLVRLSHVARLHNMLNVDVVRLLAWWSDIDTAFYLDREDEIGGVRPRSMTSCSATPTSTIRSMLRSPKTTST